MVSVLRAASISLYPAAVEPGRGYDNTQGGRGGGRGGPSAGRGGGRGGGRFAGNDGYAGGRGPIMQQQQRQQQQMLTPEQLHYKMLEQQIQAQAIMIAQQQELLMAQSGAQPPIAMMAARPLRAVQQPPAAAFEPEEPLDPKVLDMLECKEDEESGNVEVTFQNQPLVVVSLSGEVMLTTSGWYDEDTLAALNYTIAPLDMKVRWPMHGTAHGALHDGPMHGRTIPRRMVGSYPMRAVSS